MNKSILLLPFLALSIAVAAEPETEKPDIFGAIYASDMKMLERFATEDPSCLERSTKTGLLPIHYAALRNNVEALYKLSKVGAKADAVTAGSKKMTGLHIAALQNGEDSARWFLKQKLDVNTRDALGATPLHYAARCKGDSSRVIRRLLKAGADLAAKDNDGNTPLHAAALYGTKDTILTLLAAKADPSVSNKRGELPRDLAQDEGIQMLFPDVPANAEPPSVTALSEKPAPEPKTEEPTPAEAEAPAVAEDENNAEPDAEPALSAEESEPPESASGTAQNAAIAATLLDDESIPQTDRFARFLEIPGSQPMPDGTFFNGTLKNGRFEGYGVLLVRDNGRERYAGWFHNGRKNGHGIYRYANGDRIETEWKDDAPNGTGTFTFANGCVIEGTWKQGIFWEGSGQFRLGKDQLHYGAWSNGELSHSERISQ